MVEHSGCRVWATVLQFQCNLYPLHIKASAVKKETRPRFHLLCLNLLFTVVVFFQMKVSFQNTKQTLFCLQVCVFRGRCLHQLQHLFTSKKKRPQCSQAVLSTAQAFVNQSMWVYEKKKGGWASNRIPLSFLMWLVIGLFGFCVFVFYLVFKSAWQRATPLCCDTVGLWPTSKAMALRWPCP